MAYFTLREFTRSSTADRLQISNVPSNDEVRNINELISSLLTPIREIVGSPVTITSGYRCPSLNAAVGGVSTSYHVAGMAADFVVKGYNKSAMRLLYYFIKHNMQYTECIYYANRHTPFIHVAYDINNLCGKSFIDYSVD